MNCDHYDEFLRDKYSSRPTCMKQLTGWLTSLPHALLYQHSLRRKLNLTPRGIIMGHEYAS